MLTSPYPTGTAWRYRVGQLANVLSYSEGGLPLLHGDHAERAECPSGSAPRELCRQACEQLRQRLRAGEPCQAESFLSAHPGLTGEPDLVVELILTEITVRGELGQQPDPNDWYARFPQHSDRLKQALSSRRLPGGDA